MDNKYCSICNVKITLLHFKFADSETNIICENCYKNKNETIHSNIECDGCEMYPLIGVRYKCNECVDFDLCSACHQQKKEIGSHIKSHKMETILKSDDNMLNDN